VVLGQQEVLELARAEHTHVVLDKVTLGQAAVTDRKCGTAVEHQALAIDAF